MNSEPIYDVAVIGGGPAGSVTATLLARRGYAVTLLSSGKTKAYLEGLSPRAIERLRAAGLAVPEDSLAPPAPRISYWGGRAAAANQEFLVERASFDATLRQQAATAGVSVVTRRVSGPLDPAQFSARFVVDARGRQAPRSTAAKRGPKTVALWRGYYGAQSDAGTLIAAHAGGWVWAAFHPDGRAVVQATCDPGATRLTRAVMERIFDQALDACPEIGLGLRYFEPTTPVMARDAGAVLADSWDLNHGDNRPPSLRLGDAACAIDPLSGHGLYEAIASARTAETVVATILDRPEDSAIAHRFYTERAADIFFRHARIGRDFYALEKRFAEAPFWAARRSWPDAQPAHASPDLAPPRIALAPVISNGYVMEREVIVTADHPRGVLALDDVPLAPLVRLQEAIPGHTTATLAEHFQVTPKAVLRALTWLSSRGLIAVHAPE